MIKVITYSSQGDYDCAFKNTFQEPQSRFYVYYFTTYVRFYEQKNE